MTNETTASCRGPAAGDPKSEPDESSYMLRDKRPSTSIRRDQHHQNSRQERQHRTFDDSWAWYVVGGCAFANFLLPGMLRSFGPDVLNGFVEVHELEFSNRSVVGCRWIPATFNLTFFISGSLSCLLCKLISHRAVTFWGGLLASAGMMYSSFANSISHLYISYGLMVGFGAGLCYSAGILIVNEYFDKRRGLANGFSLAGTAIGALAMPPYLEFLTFSYGYRGGILIVSGMILNTLACSLTYIPAVVDADRVQQDEVTYTRPIASSTPTPTSINARAVATTAFKAATDLYYAAVVSSPSPPLLKSQTTAAAVSSTDDEDNDDDEDDDDDDCKRLKNTRWWWWLRWRHPQFGATPAAEFLAVSVVHAISHLAYATAAPARASALQLAAAEAAGRFLAPTASDLLSPGGSASIYLYAAVVAVGGTVLLTGAATAESNADPFQWPLRSAVHAQWSASLVMAFGMASGAAVGLEPLVAVRALGREQLAASCSATLLGKGAAQLAVDLFLRQSLPSRGGHWPPISPCVFYTLGSILVATAAAWTAAFLVKRHYTSKTGCNRYVRTA
ncbi:uncharacterized protein LOC132952303 [Metopolophium dirhodum]|uniref:uncharacterized protein LOC132952303 n=1 Tax=Metopolophium dirhodum TaxID=44670 RepID=UPI0029906851|nr:uncharacterized protein LOC132952303 [Metopolophium dirhodum]XP_060880559.1 uncharacterized protein LOC132952303 [Metopolophium dirhodum]XP_060880560.1 uncharacterized protein LOC132952303 [Metopolophium dirhodum]